MGDVYSIGSAGLRKLEKGGIRLQAGHAYYLGASSSPDMIIVSSVTEESVSFYRGHFRTPCQRMERPIADDLIRQGTATWLASYGKRIEEHPSEAGPELLSLVSSLRGLLEMRPSTLRHDVRDYQRVRVTVNPSHADASVDSLWPFAEQYGNVGSMGRLISIEGPRKNAMRVSTDPLFVIVTIEEMAR